MGGVALAVVASGTIAAGPDATVPPALTAWVEPAREAARREAGLFGVLPTRFIDARCTLDGRTAVLAFESAGSRAPLFATIGFPSTEDLDAPGATVTIVASEPRWDIGVSADACARIPMRRP